MKPAWSVIFLTTLIGVGQGLFLAMVGIEGAARVGMMAPVAADFFVTGSFFATLLLVCGLGASFLHLGHPERAWRAIAMWRTSWLSREVIVLPAFIAAVIAYGYAHAQGLNCTGWVAAAGVLLCVALFVCTAMIYSCLKFLQEWHTPLTSVNFFLLGTASGTLLAAALAATAWPLIVPRLAMAAAVLIAAGAVTRSLSLVRNARLRPKSTVQSATGIANPKIVQKAQGAMGGSFNTREFFHGRSTAALRWVKWFFLLAVFVLPLAMILLALEQGRSQWLVVVFGLQYAGLLAERWFFFAQARHPQNLYYQAIS
jgi:DMSO reductase anchor subunit